MPIMIRAEDKAKKICDKIMGSPKVSKSSKKKKKSDVKLDFEESRRV
jgi:hypothetical protein